MMQPPGLYQIRLSKGLFALCSWGDYEWLMQWKWYASNESRGTKWYAIRRVTINGKRVKIRMHRAVMERNYPTLMRPDAVVDHINHNSLDNSRSNLRIVTQRENMLASPGWKRQHAEL